MAEQKYLDFEGLEIFKNKMTAQIVQKEDIITSFGDTSSDSKIPSEKLVKDNLDTCVKSSNSGGLVMSVDGDILTITDGTHTWNLTATS